MKKARAIKSVSLALALLGSITLSSCSTFLSQNSSSQPCEHNWETTYTIDGSHHWYACEKCGEAKDKAEHTLIEDGECTGCGRLVIDTAGVEYAVSADGTYAEVVRYSSIGVAKKVKIADTYNGLPVKAIRDYAFAEDYTNRITRVDMPNSITTIGTAAFYGCKNLTIVNLSENVTTLTDGIFCGCISLTNINIPKNTTKIGKYAFCATALTNIAIPDTVTTIDDYAFFECGALTSISMPNSVTDIGDCAFLNSALTNVTLSSGIVNIAYGAFAACGALVEVTIPDGVTAISDYAFGECENLTKVSIPDSVTVIGVEAFSGCNQLQYSSYENCKYLGNENNAFYALIETEDTSLSSYIIHENTKVVAGFAFQDSPITNITVPESNTAYQLIDGNLYTKDGKTLVQYITGKTETSFTVPDGVTTIGACAFACSVLTDITLPESVTTLGTCAFYKCTNLTNINIPYGVTTIPEYAFARSGLTSIILPDSVATIERDAFSSCGLRNLELPDGLTKIGDYAFAYCHFSSVEIPDGVISIGNFAFFYCYSINVVIGRGVTSIGKMAFFDGSDMKSITFKDPNNWYYTHNEADFIHKVNGIHISIPASPSWSSRLTYFAYLYKK